MYAAERQRRIVATARDAGRVDVTTAAAELGVTVETIRRDLAALESRGLVRRVHGGCLPVQTQGFEPGLDARVGTHVEQKRRIASEATRLIDSGVRSIIIDAGSTTSAFATQLPALVASGRELSVVTNSLPVASALAAAPGIHLHVLGGRIRSRTLAAVGTDVESQVRDLAVDIAFLGTNGIHPSRGLTTPNADEASAKRAMAGAAESVVVLADSSKIGQTHLCRVCPMEEVDQVITDDGVDDEMRTELAEAGVEVVCA